MTGPIQTSLMDIGRLVFLLYKSIQNATFFQLEDEQKISLLNKDFFEFHPRLEIVETSSAPDDKKMRILTQEALQDTLNHCGNRLLLNSNHPVVNCENMDSAPQSRDYELLDTGNFTLQDRIELAKLGAETGSCYTCTRDRNPFDVKAKIKTYMKTDPLPPECILHTANADSRPHAKLSINVRVIQGEFQYLGLKIETSSDDLRDRLRLEIQTNFSKHDTLEVFLGSLQEKTDPTLRASSVVLDLVKIASRSNIGYIGALRKAGFEPLVRPRRADSFHNGVADIIMVLTEFVRYVSYFWNPRFFLRPTDILQTRYFEQLDIRELEEIAEEKANPVFWPMRCIRTTGKMLENIIAGAKVSSVLDPTLSKNLFLEISNDKNPNNNQIEFVLDDICMWMC